MLFLPNSRVVSETQTVRKQIQSSQSTTAKKYLLCMKVKTIKKLRKLSWRKKMLKVKYLYQMPTFVSLQPWTIFRGSCLLAVLVTFLEYSLFSEREIWCECHHIPHNLDCTLLFVFSRSMLTTTLERRSRNLWSSRAAPASMRHRNTFTCWWKEILGPDFCTQMPTWVWSTDPELFGTFSSKCCIKAASPTLTFCLSFSAWLNRKVISRCMRCGSDSVLFF